MSETATNALAIASRIIIQTMGLRPSNDDFCSTVVHRLFEKQDARSCFIAVLGNDSNIQVSGQYGFEKGLFQKVVMNIWKPSGISDAIRTREIQKVDSWEHYRELYPANKVAGLGGEGYIAIPFVGTDNSVGAIGITFHGPLSGILIHDQVIELIQLASPFFTQLNNSTPTVSNDKQIDFEKLNGQEGARLTDRELLILQLMAKGQTNQEIGLEMHLSESSIRSASVGLFRNLGVHSRKDAVAAARHLGLLEPSIAALRLAVSTPPPSDDGLGLLKTVRSRQAS